MKAETDIGYV